MKIDNKLYYDDVDDDMINSVDLELNKLEIKKILFI
jgi:hypothetical protein